MLRVFLSGQLAVEAADGRRKAGRDFPGRQGREAFAFLVLRGGMPVSRSELIGALWRGEPPAAVDSALNSVVSKLRRLVSELGLDGGRVLRFSDGCYELVLPAGTWVDHPAAFASIHEAETALKAGDPRAAYGPSAVARQICGRPFLPGSEAEWIEARRTQLRRVLVRALECRSAVYLWNGEHAFAVDTAREAVSIAPFRESSYRLLMEAHAAAGNTAEALRVYEQCRELISEELGVSPSQETREVHRRILDAL
ncbi:MAG TPA: BTAD domain-containing putative transcriptional regulator [Longimicrobiales bacterium]|nr:BTAD domain-containing putative transcriptional regulator [Longimicrobiales bacterium]